MKQLSTVLKCVLVIALAVLFGCQPSNKSENNSGTKEAVVGETDYTVAYINTDSLLLKYNYAKDLSEKIMSKQESSRANFNEKAKVFQQDAVAFQRKVQNNGFLSLDRAEKEQQRLAKAERDLQELNQRLSNELMAEQETINRQLRDTLVNYLEEYSKANPYKMILSNTMGDNVLYSAPGVDITDQIVEALNARYEAGN